MINSTWRTGAHSLKQNTDFLLHLTKVLSFLLLTPTPLIDYRIILMTVEKLMNDIGTLILPCRRPSIQLASTSLRLANLLTNKLA